MTSMPTARDGEESAGTGTPDALAMVRARSRVYGLLAAAFDGDTDTLATALEDGAFGRLAETLPADLDTAALDGADLGHEALAVGYDNLFVVPGAHYVPPFASAHATDPSEEFESDSPYHTAGEAGELLGEPAADLVKLYQSAGFEPERGDDIPDHLAATFEFMRALCDREAAVLAAEETDLPTLEAVRRRQELTLSLLGWLDDFERAVARADSAEGVFAAVATVARTFAAWDAGQERAGPE